MTTIDVRTMPPRDRHPTIFGVLDQLDAGHALRIVNDHDPVPLRYQLEATRPGQFEWQTVEDGPEQWTVDITSRARVVDARPVLAAGGEPFAMIMDAVDHLAADQPLVVLAPFEPVPLEGVLGEQGFTYQAVELGNGDWRVTFSRPSTTPSP
jgi:uncharacterized protein (DUF2249 family)